MYRFYDSDEERGPIGVFTGLSAGKYADENGIAWECIARVDGELG